MVRPPPAASFLDPRGIHFNYRLIVLAHPNLLPVFTTVPVVKTTAGKPYIYAASAFDPEGNTLHFALLGAPAGMTVNASSGLISWSPTTANIGTHSIALQVTDGRGGLAEQDYVLSVLALPNRPPIFTSEPNLDATVGAPYTYQASATDPEGDALTFSVLSAPAGLTINAQSGMVQWSNPTPAQLGTQNVVLKASDSQGGAATQVFQIVVHPDSANHAPVIVSGPATMFDFPDQSSASGIVQPQSLALPGQWPILKLDVNVTLPANFSATPKVDVFLLIDDTDSIEDNVPAIVDQFPVVQQLLQNRFPQISFAYGVGRFEDYANFAGELPQGRPFILNQPIITTNTPGFSDAMTAALQRMAPGLGGDYPESMLEALYQVATGAGFDGDGNGNTTESGAAGPSSTQTAPGTSGDVPAFNSFQADAANHVLPSSGTRGGVGFRQGALPIILVASDNGTAYEPDSPVVNPVTGVDGVQVALSRFTGSVLTSRPTTPGHRGATIQHTVPL